MTNFQFFIYYYSSMGKKSSSNSARKILWSCVFHILLLIGFISISLHLVYLYAEEPITVPSQRYLHQAFQSQPSKSQLKSFNQNKYFLIKTTCKECVNQLIKYYTHRQNISLIYKDITETKQYDHDLWSIRTLVRNTLGQQDLEIKAWVFIVSKFIPTAQIEQLKVIEPNSKIFIISQNQLKKSKDFVNAQINDFDLQKIFKYAKVPKKTAAVYANYFRSRVSEMFETFDRQFQSIQAELGGFYRPINKLSQKGLDFLSKLCKGEKFPKKTKIDEKLTKQLDEAGVILTKDRLQWKNAKYLLNYMLQKQANCTYHEQIVSNLNEQQVGKLDVQNIKQVEVEVEVKEQSDASKEQKKDTKKKKSNKKAKEETDQVKSSKKQKKTRNKKNKKAEIKVQEVKINEEDQNKQNVKQQQQITEQKPTQTPVQNIEQQNPDKNQPQITPEQEVQKNEAQNTVADIPQNQNSDTNQDEQQQQQISLVMNPYTQQNKTIGQQM